MYGNKLQNQRLAGPMILACKKLCYKIWSKNCVGILREPESGNTVFAGWTWQKQEQRLALGMYRVAKDG